MGAEVAEATLHLVARSQTMIEHFLEGFTLIILKSISTSLTLNANKAHNSEQKE